MIYQIVFILFITSVSSLETYDASVWRSSTRFKTCSDTCAENNKICDQEQMMNAKTKEVVQTALQTLLSLYKCSEYIPTKNIVGSERSTSNWFNWKCYYLEESSTIEDTAYTCNNVRVNDWYYYNFCPCTDDEQEFASHSPTSQPTSLPSSSPTISPTIEYTDTPTTQPTGYPTISPTTSPTKYPTSSPTNSPTNSPTKTNIVVDSTDTLDDDSTEPTVIINTDNTNYVTYVLAFILIIFIFSALGCIIVRLGNKRRSNYANTGMIETEATLVLPQLATVEIIKDYKNVKITPVQPSAPPICYEV